VLMRLIMRFQSLFQTKIRGDADVTDLKEKFKNEKAYAKKELAKFPIPNPKDQLSRPSQRFTQIAIGKLIDGQQNEKLEIRPMADQWNTAHNILLNEISAVTDRLRAEYDKIPDPLSPKPDSK